MEEEKKKKWRREKKFFKEFAFSDCKDFSFKKKKIVNDDVIAKAIAFPLLFPIFLFPIFTECLNENEISNKPLSKVSGTAFKPPPPLSPPPTSKCF